MRRSVVLAALVVLASELGAQAELQGRVLAEGARRPIANAMVALPRLDIRTVTDSLGKYRLAKIPRGEQLVVTRAVGYRPDSTITVFDGDEMIMSIYRGSGSKA